ncbi:ABC transporter substrate-binding protein [Pseudomonas sp. LJDD11]|uniref:ABC transporter substrate-binding protein n=1 Tax=Pseudomonas sp. LJDD11 TaxID=2931984 RepID=UPI00211BC269|nr:ABC transporter substrate-binding protein [Pseudomonas sp. LJDD11]MCQ9423123.1 ABC transporter substrate-binding protein [Pseudomonas sp. LJDD11]
MLCALGCGSGWAASVVFLSPGPASDGYWNSYARVMQAAADATGMALRVEFSDRDTRTQVDLARQTLKGDQRPDYLVFSNELNVAPEILRLAEGSGVKLLLVNNTLSLDQRRILGDLSQRYPDLLGSLLGNDEQGGYLTAKRLIKQLGPLAPGQSVDMLAFSGTNATPVSLLREKGMRRAVAEHPEVNLRQVVLGVWRRERALEQARMLFKRYPDTRLVWAANEQMAYGAMDALAEIGGVAGRDVLFSAINGTPESLQALLDGRLSAVASGHFTLGGWALVLLSDYDRQRVGGPMPLGEREIDVLQLVEPGETVRLLEAARRDSYRVDPQAFTRPATPGDSPFALRHMLPASQAPTK